MIGRLLNQRSSAFKSKKNYFSAKSVDRGSVNLSRRNYSQNYELDDSRLFHKGFDVKKFMSKDPSQHEIVKGYWEAIKPAIGTWTPAISDKLYDLKNVDVKESMDNLSADQLNYLGIHYHYGLNGYPKDLNLAEKLYIAASNKGDARGLCNLGIINLYNGQFELAHDLFIRSAKSGVSWAFMNLSKMKWDGLFGHSYDEAVFYLNEASNRDNFISTLKIAYSVISRTSQVSLVRPLAERALIQCPGLDPALTLLGRSLLASQNPDKKTAYEVLKVADESGDPDAPFFISQNKELTEKQRNEYLEKSIERGSSYGRFTKSLIQFIKEEDLNEAARLLNELITIAEQAITSDLAVRLAEVVYQKKDFPLYRKFTEKLYLNALEKGSLAACYALVEYYKKEYGEKCDEVFEMLSIGGRFYRDVNMLEELKLFYKEGPRKDAVLYNSLEDDISLLRLLETKEGTEKLLEELAAELKKH